MFHKREKSLPVEQNPVETERTPEYSEKTLDMIKLIDSGIENSQNLIGGLGRVARKQIITDPEELKEIYAPKQIGKLGLEKYDVREFKTAGRGLRIRSLISKYALRGEEGVIVDTRKLREEVKGREYNINIDELKRLKKLGLNPREINPEDFKTTFIEGKKGAEKVVLQRKTEAEMIKTAGEIMERRLKELENGQGAKLIENKESLNKFREEKKQYENVLPPESLEKLEREEADRQEIIKQNQEDLDSNLEIFGQPLYEHRKEITYNLSKFSFLLEDITTREKAYQQEITNLDKAITGVKGSKELSKSLADDIKDWEEQKAQTQVNLNGLKEKKEALNLRITELKTSQTEVDAALARINNIGKTPAELMAEKAAKQREKLEQQKRNRAYRAPDSRPEFAFGSTEAEEAGGAEAVMVAGAAAGTSPVVSASESKKPEVKVDATSGQPEKTEPAEEKIIKMQVTEWLNLLDLRNADGPAKTAVENNFKLGKKEFNLTASLTLGQVRQAYIKYIIDFRHNGRKSYLAAAKKEADDKLKKIIENL